MSETRQKTWISATEGARLLGVEKATFRKTVAESKAVTVRQYPGTQARYLRSDVERLARESVTPAIESEPAAVA